MIVRMAYYTGFSEEMQWMNDKKPANMNKKRKL